MLYQALCIISNPSMMSNFSHSPESTNWGQNWRFCCPMWPWNLTDDLKNNRAPLLSNIKLSASFHRRMWIQTGVTVRKRLSGVLTSMTLTFCCWPWPFGWSSRLSIVITPENFRMIRWEKLCQKGVTDGQTDRRTEVFLELLGRD